MWVDLGTLHCVLYLNKKIKTKHTSTTSQIYNRNMASKAEMHQFKGGMFRYLYKIATINVQSSVE